MEKKIVVKQIRSSIGRPPRVERTLIALGLNKIGKVSELTVNPAVMGMIASVKQLLEIQK